jgi:hypothetical protein
VRGDVNIYVPAPAPDQPPQAEYRNPWAELAGTHKVWERTPVLPTVVDIAAALHDRWQELAVQLAGDPWLDPEFAKRMTARLTEHLGELRFSLVEAALLVLTPLAHQVWTLESAVALLGVGPTDLRPRASTGPRDNYERFLTGPEQSRLVSRAGLTHLDGRGGQEARDAIGWWLFHQWVRDLPRDPVSHTLPVDDPTLRKVLVSTIKKLIHLFHLTPDQLRDADNRRHLRADATHPGITDALQDVDEERLGFLLVVAHELAIDVLLLPPTLVEHLGIPRPVDLTQLKTTIRHAGWKPTETGIALVAPCEHEAMLESLRDHVGHTTAALAAVHAVAAKAANLEPLRRLPVAASADYIEPALDDDNHPVFKVPVTRFRLDETRVRELLMGEQLYGDKSLAIRELYQNALDACRWRRARYESGELGAWTGGRIDFVQQKENGRHILRCTDTGIGMNESDLREVFSRAGVRFTERQEFREEEASWEAKGVRFFPNSRFGIGVLSYFMLADEIEVRTRRMNRDGGSESALRVFITGPGNLFRIEPLDEEQPVGTSVTLYLRDGSTAPSCLEVLQKYLGIAEFDTHATHDGVHDVWRRAEFTARTARTAQSGGIGVTDAVVLGDATEDGQVVWCETGGGLLVDGIHVHPPTEKSSHGDIQVTELKGAIVNLTGLRAPRLTVDRAMVRDDVTDSVTALMSAAVPRLLEANPSFLSFDWLLKVADATPAVANVITSTAVAADLRIAAASRHLIVRNTGFLPIDHKLVNGLSRTDVEMNLDSPLSDQLLLWRLLAHRGDQVLAGFAVDVPDVLPALPTDELLIGWPSLHDTVPERIPPGHVVNMAFAMNAEPTVVADRLALLRIDVSELGSFPERRSLNPSDVTLLSRDLDGQSPWLDPSTPVPLGHVIAAHRIIGIPVSEIVRRLEKYSFNTRYLVEDMSEFTYQDEFLASVDVDGKWPWLDHENRVGLGHVFYAAFTTGRKVSDVVDRLTELRFDTTPVEQPDWIDSLPPDTANVLLKEPLFRTDGAVAPAWVAYVAAEWEIPPHEAAKRLADLAYPVPGNDELPDRLDKHDANLLTYLPDSIERLRHVSVSPRTLLTAAERTNLTPLTVAAKLTALGFEVLPEKVLVRMDDFTDRWLLENVVPVRGGRENPRDALIPLLEAAWQFNLSLNDLKERLDRLGYADLVSRALPPDQSIPLAYALSGMARTSSSPSQIPDFLRMLGYSTSPTKPSMDWFDATNTNLVANLGPSMTVSVRRVIRLALTYGLTLAEVVRRLSGLGLDVPDMATELPKLLARVPSRPQP